MLIMELLRAYGGGQFIICGIFRNLADVITALQDGGSVDIVMLALALPDSRGVGTYTRFSSSFPDQPVVVLSEVDDEPIAAEAVHLGAQEYLVKNELTGKFLVNSLRYVADRCRAESALKSLREEMNTKITERTQALTKANQRLAEVLDELKNGREQAADQDRLKSLDRMAGGLAHDFNNALSPILVHSEWLLNKPGVLGNEAVVRNALAAIHQSAGQCAEMVLKVRDICRPCEEPRRVEPLDLREVLREAVSVTRPIWKDQAELRGCEIRVETDFEPVSKVRGTHEDLVELFTDLILHAVDAIQVAGVIAVKVFAPDEGYVTVSVTDNGSGLIDESGVPVRSGVGLGVVYGIAQRHGAEVDFSVLGENGACLSVRFPVGGEVPQAAEVVQPSEHLTGLRILAVDDEPSIRNILGLCLTEDGHQVELAGDDREALSKFKRNRFDLLLTDYSMPNMNGDRLAAAIRAADPKIRVALLTGFGSQLPQGAPLRLEVDSIIAKPFTFDSLRQGIAEAMAG